MSINIHSLVYLFLSYLFHQWTGLGRCIKEMYDDIDEFDRLEYRGKIFLKSIEVL